MKQLVLIAHDIRSAHNVGSLLRTAEGLGVTEVVLSGYTPYPDLYSADPRLPHERRKIVAAIQKTALGAEDSQPWRLTTEIDTLLSGLTDAGYVLAGLEQTPSSTPLPMYRFPDKLAVLLGSEVTGIKPALQQRCDVLLEIPMFGRKESFNVVQAAAMLSYQWRFKA